MNKKSNLRSIIRENVKEVLRELGGPKPKKGDRFNHNGLTWVVLDPGSSQSRAEVLTKSVAGKKGVIDNKIIIKNLLENIDFPTQIKEAKLAKLKPEDFEDDPTYAAMELGSAIGTIIEKHKKTFLSNIKKDVKSLFSANPLYKKYKDNYFDAVVENLDDDYNPITGGLKEELVDTVESA